MKCQEATSKDVCTEKKETPTLHSQRGLSTANCIPSARINPGALAM